MKKIAVVEDDKSLRTALASVLEENGYSPCLILDFINADQEILACLLYTSPSPRDYAASRMPSSA